MAKNPTMAMPIGTVSSSLAPRPIMRGPSIFLIFFFPRAGRKIKIDVIQLIATGLASVRWVKH
jgi:hypothetical protein